MKKQRENRIPIMMSDEELKAIDDWSFEHRVRTRAAAMRRLMLIGINAQQSLRDLHELITKQYLRAASIVNGEISRHSLTGKTPDQVPGVFLDLTVELLECLKTMRTESGVATFVASQLAGTVAVSSPNETQSEIEKERHRLLSELAELDVMERKSTE